MRCSPTAGRGALGAAAKANLAGSGGGISWTSSSPPSPAPSTSSSLRPCSNSRKAASKSSSSSSWGAPFLPGPGHSRSAVTRRCGCCFFLAAAAAAATPDGGGMKPERMAPPHIAAAGWWWMYYWLGVEGTSGTGKIFVVAARLWVPLWFSVSEAREGSSGGVGRMELGRW